MRDHEESIFEQLGVTKLEVCEAFVSTFANPNGKLVLDFLEFSLSARSTVRLDDFEQGRRAAFFKIKQYMELAPRLRAKHDALVNKEDDARRSKRGSRR